MPKKTFIRTLEFWLPDASGSMLEFGGGLFGNCKRFETATRSLCFGRGEGLPGQAWGAGHPILLNSLDTPAFRRAAAAQAEGLTCAIANARRTLAICAKGNGRDRSPSNQADE